MFRRQSDSVLFRHKLGDISHGHALFDGDQFVTPFAGENSHVLSSLGRQFKNHVNRMFKHPGQSRVNLIFDRLVDIEQHSAPHKD